MAEDQVGFGSDSSSNAVPWTRIFTAFKVALDPKKLLLAAGGIFVMALGWWVLAVIFYAPRSEPEWDTYKSQVGVEGGYEDDDAAWTAFKRDLNSWNLIHQLAGPVKESPKDMPRYGAEDFCNSYEEYKAVRAEKKKIIHEVRRPSRKLKFEPHSDEKKEGFFVLDKVKVHVDTGSVGATTVEKSLDNQITAQGLIDAYNETTGTDEIHIVDEENEIDYTLTFAKSETEKEAEWQKYINYVTNPKTLADIENEIIEKDIKPEDAEITRIALKILRIEDDNIYKPAGWLRTWPFFEYRGPNPFLMITGLTAGAEGGKELSPWGRGQGFFGWLLMDQIPVLLEPLVKFLSPVIYFLHPAADFWTRIYLLLVILWTIGTWSFFGGAITRMAAVQVARPTERVGLSEAIRFTTSRYKSYLAAQLLPFAFLAGVTVILFLYGFFEILIPIVGDILIAGLGFPLVLLFGLIMAVVLVGLVGWPLMYATIGAEGSDSFDAISRSYSYVYQSPWSYLWYAFVAILYGAALVFFVGFMGSLMVYLGKWGMSLPPDLWGGREPSYLFQFAPTSYGWRDLLLYESTQTEVANVVQTTGTVTQRYAFKGEYLGDLYFWNYAGASLVMIWLYLFFLMIIGFGYSFFWTASAIIYLLMRRKVDDTEIDEIHLEEDELDTPYTPPTPAEPPAEDRGTVPLSVVESAGEPSSASVAEPSTGTAEPSTGTAEPPSASPAEPSTGLAAESEAPSEERPEATADSEASPSAEPSSQDGDSEKRDGDGAAEEPVASSVGEESASDDAESEEQSEHSTSTPDDEEKDDEEEKDDTGF